MFRLPNTYSKNHFLHHSNVKLSTSYLIKLMVVYLSRKWADYFCMIFHATHRNMMTYSIKTWIWICDSSKFWTWFLYTSNFTSTAQCFLISLPVLCTDNYIYKKYEISNRRINKISFYSWQDYLTYNFMLSKMKKMRYSTRGISLQYIETDRCWLKCGWKNFRDFKSKLCVSPNILPINNEMSWIVKFNFVITLFSFDEYHR